MYQNINPMYFQNTCQPVPVQGPNAVSINIYDPRAYGSNNSATCPYQNYYPLYQQNQNPALPLYPMNYNNMFQQPMTQNQPQVQKSLGNSTSAIGDTNLIGKTNNTENNVTKETIKETEKSKEKDKKEKTKVILTDDYVKSLENYLNDDNPKVRLIAAKELMERFKEDDSRIAHPSLTPLLNKMLRDTSPSVRFLALTTLQLGYSIGNDETVQILKQIQTDNKDKLGEDALLASEILLKLSAPKVTEVK